MNAGALGATDAPAGPDTVGLASRNALKIEETRAVFPDLVSVDVNLLEVQNVDPRVVVGHKLDQVAALGLPHAVLVEDTGLALSVWRGLPGALVAWFVDGLGPAGIWEVVAPLADHAAVATSALGVVHGGERAIWTGSTAGRIVAPRGPERGWTSVFEVDGTGSTLGEMSVAQRHAVTMRRGPLLECRAWLAGRSPGPGAP